MTMRFNRWTTIVRVVGPLLGLALIAVGIVAVVRVFFLQVTPSITVAELTKEIESKDTTVTKYKYTMHSRSTSQTVRDAPLMEGTTEFTFVFGEGVHIVSPGDDSQGETLLVEGGQYSRQSPDDAWRYTPRRRQEFSDPRSKLTPADTVGMLKQLNNLEVVGTETLNGVKVWKVTGQYDMLTKANAIWDEAERDADSREDPYAQYVSGTEEFTGWIGVEDGLLHANEVSGSYPEKGDLLAHTRWYRIEYSDFNETLTLPTIASVDLTPTRTPNSVPTNTPVRPSPTRESLDLP